MAELNFPASPTNGQTFTSGGKTWTYNSTDGVWELNISGSNVTITGGTISGLSTPLPVASGGTGGGSQSAARTGLGLVIGTDVQAYNANTTFKNVAQSWTASQRSTPITDNDGSFDLNAGNDFICSPSGNITLQFTNESAGAGQRGIIFLSNPSGHTISIGAECLEDSKAASTLSIAGYYIISYWCYNGTNVAISYSQALT